LGSASALYATIYSFTDDKGVVHFTNVPTDSRFKVLFPDKKKSLGEESTYNSIIREASKRYGVESAIIKAVIKVESDFNPQATSSKGAMGLMQIMPDTARELKVSDCYDPRANIFAGTRYLKKLLKIFNGDLRLVLASYNAGLTKVRDSHTVPDIRETRDYVEKVLLCYEDYK